MTPGTVAEGLTGVWIRDEPVRRVMLTCGLVAGGYLLGRATGLADAAHSDLYAWAVCLLLAVGLYGSTYGIDRTAALENVRVVVLAVTVGVVAKAALIGGVLWFLTADPLFLVLGVVMAQIDPLSVAALMREPRLSSRAKAVLGCWSSFDDPVTVVLTVYSAAVAARLLDGGDAPQAVAAGTFGGVYLADLALNALFVGGAAVGWLLVRRRGRPAQLLALAGLFVIAVSGFLMLGLAVAGLFFRPGLDRVVPRAVSGALGASLVALGVLLVGGVDPLRGIAVGCAAFFAQAAVAAALTAHMSRRDRFHLAFAQQNGITAIILALLLEQAFPGTVAIIAPAILTVNTLHMIMNRTVDRWHLDRERV